MTSRELEIHANDAISYFYQQQRTGWVLYLESLKPITPEVFPK